MEPEAAELGGGIGSIKKRSNIFTYHPVYNEKSKLLIAEPAIRRVSSRYVF